MKYDVIVIGAGPGGYVAAIRAAQLGFNTAVVERSELGGICLNWGCIPTKALLKSAQALHYAERGADYGFTAGEVKADLAAIVARSRGVSSTMNKGVEYLFKKNKVTVIKGIAAFRAHRRREDLVLLSGACTRRTAQVAGRHRQRRHRQRVRLLLSLSWR